MNADDFRLAVGDALRATSTSSAAELVLASANTGASALDRHDTFELLAQWVTEALDPDGTRTPPAEGTEPVYFRLHGIEATETARRGGGRG